MESILITTGVHLSSDVLELANAQNIDVVFLNKFGDPYAHVWQAKMGSTAAIRRRQIEIAEGAEGLTLVLDWCQAKVRNQIEFLEELRRRPNRRPSSISRSFPYATALLKCWNWREAWKKNAGPSWVWKAALPGPISAA